MASSTRSQAISGEAATPKKSGSGVSVLFVCMGNICRSPMAEAVFQSLANYGTSKQHPLISRIDSCGIIADFHSGQQPDSRTLAVLRDKAGIRDYTHSARKIRMPRDFVEFDYLIGMDEDNMIDIHELLKKGKKKGVLDGSEEGKIWQYGAFGGKGEDEEVQDPYYGKKDGFSIAYEQVTRMGRGLLKHIEEEAKAAEKDGK